MRLTVNSQRAGYSQVELLAALQAYLLYSMILFSDHESPRQFVEQDIMIKLQDLAGDIAGKGTVCLVDPGDARPDWESWIIASATQRTLFVTSLFDNLVNFTVGSLSFIATELAELPAPASKRLWESSSRGSWNAAYDEYIGGWRGEHFLISELWFRVEGMSPSIEERLRKWLSGVDEFGMMIYCVTSQTYGG